MAFLRHDHQVTWHSLQTLSRQANILVLQGDTLMTSLLEEFADIFEEPHSLPPQRRYDHHIHLLLGTAPVAVRPYRYP